MMRKVRRPLAATLATVAAATLGAALLAPGGASAAPAATTSYRNPVSQGFADTFADPSLIRGKDGFWYAYGTSDPLREGEGRPHRIPIARSADLVDWSHVADAFTDATVPPWAEADAGIWAPDIRYVDGQYRLYYVVTQTTATDERGRQRDRHGHRPHADRPVDGQRRAGRRPAARRPGRRRQLPVDLRPDGRHRHRRQPVAVLRLLLRRPVHHQADRRRHDGGRHARSRSPSTTSSRARTSSAATATGTSSPRPPTAVPGPPPGTASRSGARAACRAPTSTGRACR